MAIYRETAHTLFGDGGTAYDNPKPAARTVREPVRTRAPEPAAKPFTRDTTVRTAPAAATTADSSFMAAPAFGERPVARRSGSATRPLIIAGIAGIIALGVGAVVLMNGNNEGLETTTVETPAAALPTPMPTPAPVESTAATPAPIPAAPVATTRVTSTPAPAVRRAAAPAARRAAPSTAPAETVTVPTGPAPYSSLPDPVAPTAVAPAVPAPPPVIAPEPVPAPAPEPTPVPQ